MNFTEFQNNDDQRNSDRHTNINDLNNDIMIDSIVKDLKQIFVEPDKIKEEIDHLIIECFKNGEIDVLEKCNKDAINVYSYFSNVKNFLNNWKGSNE